MPNRKATPYAKKIAAQYHIDLEAVPASGSSGEILSRDVEKAHSGRKSIREVPVTPLAARIAAERGIDLANIRGTGIGGKISKKDVLAASGRVPVDLKPGELRVSLTGLRKTMAERMARSGQIPATTLVTPADVTELLRVRARVNAEKGVHYTLNDLVLRAAALALIGNKRILCSFDDGSVIYKSDINLGVAMSTDEGLLVPVIREADTLGLPELSEKVRDLSARAKERKLLPDECAGNTFTVTNLGMYGVEQFTPLINPPDAAILGVGAAIPDGSTGRTVLRLCLTFDHRLLDGREAAQFNLAVKELLEDPDRLFEM